MSHNTLRPPVPRSRPGARATGRRSAAWSTACRRGIALAEADIQPWLDRRRPGQSSFVTQRREDRRGADPVRRVRGQDHRHADLAADQERGPALARTTARSRTSSGPATPTSPTGPSIRHPRLSRRRPLLARARPPRASPPARSRARCWRTWCTSRWRSAAPWSRSAASAHRPRALGLGRDRAQPLLVPRRRGGAAMGGAARPHAQGRLLGRRGDRGGRARACRPGSARRSTASSTPTSPRR